MFLIPTLLKKSDLDGFGVFAFEDIPKGTKVISLTHELSFTSDAMIALPIPAKLYIMHYGYRRNDRYFLPMDNERFLNHSYSPNLGCTGEQYVGEEALRDIKAGEELTVNYRTFDDNYERPPLK
jgi:SET domain-containing protein